MKIYSSESTTRPLTIDDVSSPTTVYVNEDIREVTRSDEITGETNIGYVYKVREFSRKEYEDLKTSEYILELEMELAGVQL